MCKSQLPGLPISTGAVAGTGCLSPYCLGSRLVVLCAVRMATLLRAQLRRDAAVLGRLGVGPRSLDLKGS